MIICFSAALAILLVVLGIIIGRNTKGNNPPECPICGHRHTQAGDQPQQDKTNPDTKRADWWKDGGAPPDWEA